MRNVESVLKSLYLNTILFELTNEVFKNVKVK